MNIEGTGRSKKGQVAEMMYGIIYDAVKRKADTTPPNDYIGNVEMAAGIGIVLHQINREMDMEQAETPQDIKDIFLKIADEIQTDSMDDLCRIIIEKVKKYQVKKMVNETMEDLHILVRDYRKILSGEEIHPEQ